MKIWIAARRVAAVGVMVVAAAGPAVAGSAAPVRTQTAVFAGGCFWGLEAVFERLRGVSKVVAGFAGGNAVDATYDTVSSGTTGHAESVAISYDPAQISYPTLLKVYFTVAHDPTELNRQGPDEGPQYRSEIFYTDAQQRRDAQAAIAGLTAARAYGAPIVTKVEPLRGFFAAEPYHQHFYDRNPNYPYIVFNDKPKVEQLRAQFPDLVQPGK